jgi:hypothetical protein
MTQMGQKPTSTMPASRLLHPQRPTLISGSCTSTQGHTGLNAQEAFIAAVSLRLPRLWTWHRSRTWHGSGTWHRSRSTCGAGSGWILSAGTCRRTARPTPASPDAPPGISMCRLEFRHGDDRAAKPHRCAVPGIPISHRWRPVRSGRRRHWGWRHR